MRSIRCPECGKTAYEVPLPRYAAGSFGPLVEASCPSCLADLRVYEADLR